jgi:succinoglycan biosynthesis transport protein ExoP
MPDRDELKLRWLFAVIRRWLWLIVLCTVLAGGIAFAITSLMPQVYSASAMLLVDNARATGRSDYSDILASERLASTYSQMLTGQPMLEAAIAELGLEERPGELAKRVNVASVPDTQLIRLSVEDAEPSQATLIANTMVDISLERIQALQAERYTESLTSVKDQMGELSALMEVIQAEIDTLSVKKVQEEAELARKESLLAEYRSDYRLLQRDHEELQLTAAQTVDNIHVVDVAQLPQSPGQSVYTATATLLVNQALPTEIGDYSAILASERRASTYSRMVTGRPVLEAAVAQLGLDESLDAVARRVEVESVPDTQLIRLSVEDRDPTQAGLLANAIAEAFVAQMQALQQEPYTSFLTSMQQRIDELSALVDATQAEVDALSTNLIQEEADLTRKESLLAEYHSDYRSLQQSLGQLQLTVAQSTDNVIVVDNAQVPEIPIRPRPLQTTVLAALAGIIVGVGGAFVIEYLDDTVKTAEDVKQMTDLPTLGTIGRIEGSTPSEKMVSAQQALSLVVEAYRTLRTNIQVSSVDKPIRILIVTSPNPREGKSTTAANLGAVMAQSGRSVILVDADLRRSSLHRFFEVPNKQGLTDILLQDEPILDGSLQQTKIEHLRVLTSGPLPPNPPELLGSEKMHRLIENLTEKADMIIFDTPPLLPVSDARVLAAKSDGVLLVTNAGRTRRQAVQQATESLRQTGTSILGVVLNGVPVQQSVTYYGHDENGGRRPDHPPRWQKSPFGALARRLKELKEPIGAGMRNRGEL